MPAQLLVSCLAVSLLASIAPAQFVVQDDLGRLGVDDFEITPDGHFAVGRENTISTTMLV